MAKSNHVWIVDDDKSIRWVLERALSRSGIQVDIFSDAESLLSEINSSNFLISKSLAACKTFKVPCIFVSI